MCVCVVMIVSVLLLVLCLVMSFLQVVDRQFLGFVECMRCRLFLPMFAVSVCQSVSCGLNRWWRVQCTPRAVSAGSFFVKCLWPLVFKQCMIFTTYFRTESAVRLWLCRSVFDTFCLYYTSDIDVCSLSLRLMGHCAMLLM